MNGKYFVIGDIHGNYKGLKHLVDGVPGDRTIIFIGDYVNRGVDSKKVIRYLIDVSNYRKCIFIIGNHELVLLQYLNDGEFPTFARYGGINTIKSYILEAYDDVRKEFKESIPLEHLSFINNLLPFYEDEQYFFSHSGINIESPESRKVIDLCNNNDFNSQIKNSIANKVKVFGHYSLTNGAFVSNTNICIDTGSGSDNGYLSGIFLPERKIKKAPNI